MASIKVQFAAGFHPADIPSIIPSLQLNLVECTTCEEEGGSSHGTTTIIISTYNYSSAIGLRYDRRGAAQAISVVLNQFSCVDNCLLVKKFPTKK